MSAALFLVLVASSLPASAVPPQSRRSTIPPKTGTPGLPAAAPDEGTVSGNTYTSDYFHFVFTIPTDLSVQEDLMQGSEDESKRSFVLLAAYGPAEKEGFRKGIVVVADALDTPAEAAGEYLKDLVHAQFEAKGFDANHAPRDYTIAGRKFARADYRKEDVYQSVVVAVWRGYAVVFTLVAPSAEEIDQLFASIEGVKPVPPLPPGIMKPHARQ